VLSGYPISVPGPVTRNLTGTGTRCKGVRGTGLEPLPPFPRGVFFWGI
jgi:hypothetical protein